jgi:hypothetical protein
LFTPFVTALRERYTQLGDTQLALLAEVFHDIASIQLEAAHDLTPRAKALHDPEPERAVPETAGPTGSGRSA